MINQHWEECKGTVSVSHVLLGGHLFPPSAPVPQIGDRLVSNQSTLGGMQRQSLSAMSSWEGTFSPLSASVPQFGNILLSSSLLGGRDCYCPFNTCRWEGLLSSVQHFLLLINQHFKLCMSGSLPHAEAEVNGISSATDNNSQSSLPRRHNLREPSPC